MNPYLKAKTGGWAKHSQMEKKRAASKAYWEQRGNPYQKTSRAPTRANSWSAEHKEVVQKALKKQNDEKAYWKTASDMAHEPEKYRHTAAPLIPAVNNIQQGNLVRQHSIKPTIANPYLTKRPTTQVGPLKNTWQLQRQLQPHGFNLKIRTPEKDTDSWRQLQQYRKYKLSLQPKPVQKGQQRLTEHYNQPIQPAKVTKYTNNIMPLK